MVINEVLKKLFKSESSKNLRINTNVSNDRKLVLPIDNKAKNTIELLWQSGLVVLFNVRINTM